MRICPQKLNTFWLIVAWKPFTNDNVTIMTATLMAVAVTDRRMINRENDFCRLKATRFAIKLATFRFSNLSFQK
jgi:hypothetical protein